VEMLTLYCDAATAEFRGRDTETDFLLARWKDTLVQLVTKPENLVGRVDWITKSWLLEQFRAQEGLDWDDPWLKSQDLEYHAVDPERSLGLALAKPPPEWNPTPSDIEASMLQAPADSRAAARSGLMRELQRHGSAYYLDWEIIGTEGGNPLQLLNPFESKPTEAEAWVKELGTGKRRGD
jgi:proteasome accessory factor A